jgi:hypothetical protein
LVFWSFFLFGFFCAFFVWSFACLTICVNASKNAGGMAAERVMNCKCQTRLG